MSCSPPLCKSLWGLGPGSEIPLRDLLGRSVFFYTLFQDEVGTVNTISHQGGCELHTGKTKSKNPTEMTSANAALHLSRGILGGLTRCLPQPRAPCSPRGLAHSHPEGTKAPIDRRALALRWWIAKRIKLNE